jgi:hypothetical protein
MAAPIIWNGKKAKVLAPNGIILQNGVTLTQNGSLNYINEVNGDLIGEWTTYNDGAANPVDGTGGTPTSGFTYTVSTDSSMRGTTNFLLTKPALNCLGSGFSYPFTIDPSDSGKILQISLEYRVDSGIYNDDDLQFYVYYKDATNHTVIQPAPYKVKNSGLIEKFCMEFQTIGGAGATYNYNLIAIHTATTTTAYTIRFTNWNLGPQAKLYGSAITDWVAYTPTFTGFGTPTAVGFEYRRVGSNIEIRGKFTTGTNTATEARISFPFTSADTTLIPSIQAVGYVGQGQSAAGFTQVLIEPSVSYITFSYQSVASNGLTKQNGNNVFSSSAPQSVFAEFPIQGWSSSQVMSSDSASYPIVLIANTIAATSITNTNSGITVLKPSVVIKDSVSGYDLSTGLYTVKVPGQYQVTGAAYVVSGANIWAISVYKNSLIQASSPYPYLGNVTTPQQVNAIVDCIAGDTISLRGTIASGTSTSTIGTSDPTVDRLTITRISGPAQIAASESVSALYTGAPATIVSGTLAAGNAILAYGTKVKDTHGSYGVTTGIYKVPVSGAYSISTQVLIQGTYIVNQYAAINVYIDGIQSYEYYQRCGGSVSDAFPVLNVESIPLLAGQQITIVAQANGTGMTILANSIVNFFSITRTGNY